MKKDFLIILSVVFLVVVLVMGTDFQSVEDYYLTHVDDITPESETVFVSIRCDTILQNWDNLRKELRSDEFVPKDGVILKKTEFVLREGDTAFNMLQRVTRYNRIQMEYQGADLNKFGSVYIRGINYLYEFSCGELSGWMFKVNGEFLNYGCSKYELKDGDVVEWIYTCDLGRDIGGGFAYSEQKGGAEQ
jgi:hypothetical protein